ncbi:MULTISPECIES: YceI family protein [Petrimonas]|jgi:hypothetical protein|uniref:Lipid/polyisoprenoid-binding YceI-like domain-containing protein n=2 Tax=Petrimonas mucosa TaxID=1642646 RepID=A0A1G4G6I0_9BACT|nr:MULTISPECIES: YceI family protein [Petrimonas]MDD3560184.1 YceI family protein [Petrimonas mucosa]SCM57421.1 putative protein {ECO:0000313/EMBL:CEA16229,1} [Petrimonas mucosa]SFU33067.1 YceI-like domain-containing protein [Porphyromonadaceae bacterium KHP3R9]HHT29167.1 YceI family protein [Petrimonas mucosa]
MKRVVTYLIIGILYTGVLVAQTSSAVVEVEVDRSSILSINGSSNVVDFTLSQGSENFIQKKLIVTASQHNRKLYLSENRLTVPVKKFTSSNKMALRDFNKLLQSDKFPTMDIRLNHVDLPEAGSTTGLAVVDVTITGITKKYQFPIKTERSGKGYIFDVEKSINIRDFGLEPPVQMMGMLKVNEMININLRVKCNIQPAESAQLNQLHNK